MDDSRVQSAFLGAIISLAITVSVLLRRNKDLRQKLFVVFSGNITLYYFFSFLYVWRGEPWFERIALALAICIPQGGLYFFRAFSAGSRGRIRFARMAIFLGVLLIGVVLHPSWLKPAVGPAVLAYVLGFMLVAILDLNVQARLATTRVDAARIRYLFAGGLAVLLLQVIELFSQIIDVEPPPVGLVGTLLYLYVISQAIVRYRIFDLYEMLGRFLVLTLMGASLAGIYTALVFWVGKGFAVNAFLASLVILLLFDPLRDLVEQKIGDFFFGERHVLEENIVTLRSHLAHTIDIDTMKDVLLDGLETSRRITHASLYLIDPHGRGFERSGSIGQPPELDYLDVASAKRHLRLFPTSSAIVRTHLVERRGKALQNDKRDVAEQIGETLEILDNIRADILLPIEGEAELLGFLAVRDDRIRDAFSPEEVLLLSGLAGQISITIENSHIYRQMKERDRLASLGEMSAGLAHEIRNPLGAIKAAAQFIEDEMKYNGTQKNHKLDDNEEFLSIIVEEVDRLNRVVSDFLAYARPSTQSATRVAVNEILKRTIQVFETGREDQVDLLVQCSDDLPDVEINGERLHQVFFNLIINSVQAMDGNDHGRLDIVTRQRTVRRQHKRALGLETAQFVEIKFTDNGPGIAPENLESVFIPFFTTKQKGSGLGLAVCQRIVGDAGGEIELRSQKGQGSIFTVVLPACDPKRSSSAPAIDTLH